MSENSLEEVAPQKHFSARKFRGKPLPEIGDSELSEALLYTLQMAAALRNEIQYRRNIARHAAQSGESQ